MKTSEKPETPKTSKAAAVALAVILAAVLVGVVGTIVKVKIENYNRAVRAEEETRVIDAKKADEAAKLAADIEAAGGQAAYDEKLKAAEEQRQAANKKAREERAVEIAAKAAAAAREAVEGSFECRSTVALLNEMAEVQLRKLRYDDERRTGPAHTFTIQVGLDGWGDRVYLDQHEGTSGWTWESEHGPSSHVKIILLNDEMQPKLYPARVAECR